MSNVKSQISNLINHNLSQRIVFLGDRCVFLPELLHLVGRRLQEQFVSLFLNPVYHHAETDLMRVQRRLERLLFLALHIHLAQDSGLHHSSQ